jgi:DNA-directed RNA polymerase subunit RPC12/RpoP
VADDGWFDVHDQRNYLVRCLVCGAGFIEEWDTVACPHCGSEDY